MAEFLDFPTLIIIGVAIFVFFRLRSVLGTRTGNERPPSDRFSESGQENRARGAENKSDDVVVPLRPTANQNEDDGQEEFDRAMRKFEAELDRYVGKDEKLRATLLQIAEHDHSFTPKSFQSGAAAAYEMILTAFNAGDTGTLTPLLEKDVLDGFQAAIKGREADGYSIDFTFVGLPKIEYVDASLEKRVASVTMRFEAEVVSATRNKDGELVEGDAERVYSITDEWTFSRSTKSRDPNWKLVATNQVG